MKRNFLCIVLLMVFLFVSTVGAVPVPVDVFAYENTEGFGNLPYVLLNGGYSADCGNSVVFADFEDNGKLCIRNTETGETKKISDKPASFINVVGNKVYFIAESGSGSEIVTLRIGFSEKTLLKSKTKLSNLFVSSEGMYYLEGSKACYYDFAKESTNCIFENEKMFAFVPQENGDICWLEKKDYVETAAYHEGLEGTEDRDLEFSCFRFDVSKNTNTEINFGTVIAPDAVDKATSDNLNSLKLSAVIGGKKIPTEEYPVGSKFTDNGLGCTDHKTDVCGYEEEEMCNCKAYYNGTPLYAVQCYGYARYLYLYLFGYIGAPGDKRNINLGSLPEGTVTVEAFKELFRNAKPGAQMRVTYLKPDGETVSTHSLIILDWNDVGFSACEGNLDAQCGVFVKRRAFEEYVPTLISVDFFALPNNYPDEPDGDTTTEASISTTEAATNITEVQTTEPPKNDNFDFLISFFKLIAEFFFEFFGIFIGL